MGEFCQLERDRVSVNDTGGGETEANIHSVIPQREREGEKTHCRHYPNTCTPSQGRHTTPLSTSYQLHSASPD